MTTLCCETDFVAKSDDFSATAERLCDYAMACEADEGAENIIKTSLDGETFAEVITDSVSKTGEKTEVGDYARFKVDGSGLISAYIQFNNKVGSMLLIEADNDSVAGSDGIQQVASDIAMHITAIKPLALDKKDIDPKVVEQEKAIYAEQVKNKPENIIEKIVEGKMGKFFTENCLLQQPFVKDDSQTVEQVLSEAAKQAGGQAKITKFVRFEVGQ
jgi:elongation factor Ts